MNRIQRNKRRLRSDRGSALLVSLMVIVGLSLLGLGFVAISETETAIAKNEQSVVQTQAVAEAGVKLIVEWFQDPVWAQTTAGMPSNDPTVNANLAAIKTIRVSGPDTGVYKPNAGIRLLEKPYRPQFQNRFYGDENSADLIINQTTDSTTINAINNLLLGPNAEDKRDGEITEIKIFAPPIVGGNLVANGAATNADGTPQRFWVAGQRFGVATITATAMMFRDRTLAGAAKMAPSNVLATHSVRLVVGELPIPIPGGPIQSNTSLSFGGNFTIHWGNQTSAGSLSSNRDPSSLPWANAYERPHYEHGYEPGTTISQVVVNTGGTGYTSAPVVSILGSGAGATATATVAGGSVTAITVNTRGAGYSTSSPQPTVTLTGGGYTTIATASAIVAAEVWPITGATFDTQNYFAELIDKIYEDPWYGARAVGDDLADGAGGPPQVYTYLYTNNESATPYTFHFQFQNANVFPYKRKVIFPVIKYDFWKRVAKQGRGYRGIYYFSFDKAAGSGYKKGGVGATQSEVYWSNSLKPGAGGQLGAGVYFFDTVDAINPQNLTGAARTAQFTPAEMWNAAGFSGAFLMEGFVYVHNSSWGTRGAGSAQQSIVDSNFPGESYRDIGYPIWDAAANAWNTTCGGTICRGGAGDGAFSYQDLNGNGKFDVVVMLAPSFTSYDPVPNTRATATKYVPKVWKSPAQATADYGAPCTVPAAGYNGTNAAATDCSEPHEPYLNFQYPASRFSPVTVGWQAPGVQNFQPKVAGVTCTSASSQSDCTSNAYDLDGAQVPMVAILDGIFYTEGDFQSDGNADYYGSVLVNGAASGNGTPRIWFDEKLTKGTWAPKNLPRVIVYNEQTDEEQQ